VRGLSMQDVCAVIDALPAPPSYNCGPNGVTVKEAAPNSPLGWHACRIESGSGIAGRGGHWALVHIASGERSPSVTTRRDLRRLLMEHLTNQQKSQLDGYMFYARFEENRLGCGYIWVQRRKDRRQALVAASPRSR
jgi:hypothetical protein